MNRNVVVLEARGGTDKGQYGHRVDSKAIIESLRKRNWPAEIIFYDDKDRGEIYRYIIGNAGAYISRVNPGNLKDETGYHQMLRELVQNGVQGLPHPDAMVNYGAKNAVEKLKGTSLVPDDVYSYYDFETFKENLPKTLATGTRVLKQNRGSTGEGIWRVEVVESGLSDNAPITGDSKLKCTEARDNHVELMSLAEFTDFCVKYLEGENGMILDMPYLPRIVEGEIRVFMLRRTPVNIVHKKPAAGADAFSATLFSGAKYTYETPDRWPELMKIINSSLDSMITKLGGYEIPLIWTADFILDTDKQTGKDKYVLGEINASCVGFSTHLELSENIAEEVIRLMEAESLVNRKWAAFAK